MRTCRSSWTPAGAGRGRREGMGGRRGRNGNKGGGGTACGWTRLVCVCQNWQSGEQHVKCAECTWIYLPETLWCCLLLTISLIHEPDSAASSVVQILCGPCKQSEVSFVQHTHTRLHQLMSCHPHLCVRCTCVCPCAWRMASAAHPHPPSNSVSSLRMVWICWCAHRAGWLPMLTGAAWC